MFRILRDFVKFKSLRSRKSETDSRRLLLLESQVFQKKNLKIGTRHRTRDSTLQRDMEMKRPYVGRIETEFRIGYCTDIEGNVEFFLNYLEVSDVLYWNADGEENVGGLSPMQRLQKAHFGSTGRLDLRENTCFVYGGDMYDKGPGDMILSSLLVDLKRRYWDRVFLIIGNRDANKLRFTSELHEDEVKVTVPAIVPVGCKIDGLGYPDLPTEEAQVHRLKWMLINTLGSPKAFEFRRQELEIYFGKYNVSDVEVMESFLKSVDPKASDRCFVWDYLQVAQIGVVINDVFFVHGGIPDFGINFVPDALRLRFFGRYTGKIVYAHREDVPGFRIPMHKAGSLVEWLDAMNAFKQDCLKDFNNNPLWHKDASGTYYRRGGEGLYGYIGRPTHGLSIVVTNFYESNSADKVLRPLKLSDSFLSYFEKNAINYIIVGHKPVGTSPLVIHSDSANKIHGLEPESTHQMRIILADTSFSDTSLKSAPHTRGKAASEIQIFKKAQNGISPVVIKGVFPDTSSYCFSLSSQEPSNELAGLENLIYDQKQLIGHVSRNKSEKEYWIKALLSHDEYLLCKMVGYKDTYIQHSSSSL